MKNTVDMINVDCTGCRACEQVCPKDAIKMEENKEGFLYPKIDKDKCVECGLCLKKCHTQKQSIQDKIEPKFLAIKPIRKDIAAKSTSGGLACIISNYIIKNEGIVFGAAYDENLYVKHIATENDKELEKLRGSKYVISDTEKTFSQVKEKLDNGIKVLYTGTACQIAGLKTFLGRDYENLYTLDIVCHGTPSFKLFSKYIEYLEQKYNAKVIEYEFRNKDKKQWGMGFVAKIKLNCKNKTKIKYLKADFDPYYTNFLKGNSYRESCYLCKYANYSKRPADLTLADFWGIEKFRPEFYDKNGVSLCIVNTVKGKELLKSINNQIVIENTKKEEAISQNGNLIKPTFRPKTRDTIYNEIDILTAKEFVNKSLKVKKSIILFLKHMAPKKIRMIYKKYRR